MVGQLPLEQPIGVRIPGGQPNNLFTFSTLRVVRKLLPIPCSAFAPCLRLLPPLFGERCRECQSKPLRAPDQVTVDIDCDPYATVAHLLLNRRNSAAESVRTEGMAQIGGSGTSGDQPLQSWLYPLTLRTEHRPTSRQSIRSCGVRTGKV
jgi:hypothetical protein